MKKLLLSLSCILVTSAVCNNIEQSNAQIIPASTEQQQSPDCSPMIAIMIKLMEQHFQEKDHITRTKAAEMFAERIFKEIFSSNSKETAHKKLDEIWNCFEKSQVAPVKKNS